MFSGVRVLRLEGVLAQPSARKSSAHGAEPPVERPRKRRKRTKNTQHDAISGESVSGEAIVALEDGFAEVFRRSRGKVDPKLKLGF